MTSLVVSNSWNQTKFRFDRNRRHQAAVPAYEKQILQKRDRSFASFRGAFQADARVDPTPAEPGLAQLPPGFDVRLAGGGGAMLG